MRGFPKRTVGFVAFIISVFVCPALAQIEHIRPVPPNVIMPHSRQYAFVLPQHERAIEITDVEVKIDILEQTATTTIEIRLENKSNRRQEAELVLPVPDGAVIRGFAYDGPHGEITAKVLPKDEAKRIYEQLVSKIRDPALVEFIGYNLIQSSVFPVEPRGKQKVRLTYEHLLESDINRIDYVLPRTESLEYSVPWRITANIKAKRPISTVYSASHKVYINRESDREVSVKIDVEAERKPGPFRLSYLLEKNGITASMFACPDEKVGGGYFLLLAGLPADASKEEGKIKREVTIVIDRSGSMRNEKIEQAKEAALQVIAGLNDGEAFNIIIYSNNVEFFSEKPVIKKKETEEAAKKYIEGITANGGTNIYDALLTALKQKPTEGMLPIVLFLTDGLPTVGNTSEVVIRELVIKSNPYNRRVFTFGVGFDVNAPLLEKIAQESRAKSEFVLPQEDVEVKIGKVFRGLSGPILADTKLEVLDKDGDRAIGRVRDILPSKLPDLFEGDQLVLVGQFVSTEPIQFKISGNYLGKERSFKFTFEFDKADVRNGFVSRLWASRKIAELIDLVRQMGAEPGVSTNDPKIKELVDEIVKLSTEFGILTEYTAFLAKEGTELHDHGVVLETAAGNLQKRAVSARTGMDSVNQSFNISSMKSESSATGGYGGGYSNEYLDGNMQRVRISNVQQINDRAYYNKANRWVDSRLVEKEKDIKPDKTIEFGSKEYFELAEKLAKQNRQGSIALNGDVLMQFEGQTILIKMPTN